MGLVEVTVRLPADIDPDLSLQLTERYAPVEAIVIACADESIPSMREAVARAAAALLSEVLTEHDILGLTCSHTVTAATLALSRLAPCPVVQLAARWRAPMWRREASRACAERPRSAAGRRSRSIRRCCSRTRQRPGPWPNSPPSDR